jgi:hypothetical protein
MYALVLKTKYQGDKKLITQSQNILRHTNYKDPQKLN